MRRSLNMVTSLCVGVVANAERCDEVSTWSHRSALATTPTQSDVTMLRLRRMVLFHHFYCWLRPVGLAFAPLIAINFTGLPEALICACAVIPVEGTRNAVPTGIFLNS